MRSRIISALFILFSVSCSTTLAQQLNADEQRIVDYIDRNAESAVSLLERSVNIQSRTEDAEGVKRLGEIYANELRALGMDVTWADMPRETGKAGHLIAETKGTRGKRLLLLGHMDTVLAGEPYRRDGGRAFGSGVSDMKGGNAIAIQALKALHAAGLLKETRIILLFTGDEENSCEPVSLCRGHMISAANRSDAAVSFEGSVGNTATVGRRGSSSWTLEVEAKTGHSSQIFRESMGNGAIFEAARILNEFRTALGNEKYLTFNPSLFLGGTTAEAKDAAGSATGKTNVVPARVIVNGDLRFISEEQKESARAKMRQIAAKNLAGASAKITFHDGIPAMTPVPGNYDLLKVLDQASRDLGTGPVAALDPGERGAGDIAYISHLIPGLDGIGVVGGNSHAKGEWAEIESMPMLTKRAALLIYRLTR